MTTKEQLAALEQAYMSGVREYTYDGKRVVYHTMTEMRSAIEWMRGELARPGGRPAPRYGLATFGRGD